MPVDTCQMDGKPGFQFGDSGTCYTYTSGDVAGRARAEGLAEEQQAAAFAAGFTESSKNLAKCLECPTCVHCSSEDMSKQLASDLDLPSLTDAELSAGHDEAHELYAMAIRGVDVGVVVADLVGIHARIVGELVARGIAHPRPPADMLDGTTSPRPDGNTANTAAPVQNAQHLGGGGTPCPPGSKRGPDGECVPIENVEKYDTTIIVPVFKVDDEKRLVTGIVLEPDQIDAHGDFEKAETIQRAAHQFLAAFNETTKLGVQHTLFGDIGVELVESYIAPVDMTFGTEVVKAGSWVMTVKVLDEVLWQAVKSGAITGFSIGGVATVAGVE